MKYPVKRVTLNVEETATYLGVSRDLIYKMAKEKQIPHVRMGNRILFKKEILDDWMDEKLDESVGGS